MKNALFFLKLFACIGISQMIPLIGPIVRTDFVCTCSGPESQVKCRYKRYKRTEARRIVRRSNYRSVIGKCNNPNTKFRVCQCNSAGKQCKNTTIPAPSVPRQVRKNTTSFGVCGKNVITNTTTTNTTKPVNNTNTTNTTTRFLSYWDI